MKQIQRLLSVNLHAALRLVVGRMTTIAARHADLACSSACPPGDFKPVTVGNNSNIQDAAYVGATSENSPPVTIGDNVSIGHGAVLKGCTIGNNVLIGINAVVSEGVEVSQVLRDSCSMWGKH